VNSITLFWKKVIWFTQ